MNRLTIITDIFDPESAEHIITGDQLAEIRRKFPVWPGAARIYKGHVAQENDVTPVTTADVAALETTEDDLTVVVFPGTGVEIALLLLSVVAVGVSIYLASQIPDLPSAENQRAQSPNNALSDRENRARLNQRIPDIFGTVRSTPDLIASPYKIFEDNKEVEYSTMCIGRGFYDIDDVRDDTTPVTEIEGTSVNVFDPNTDASIDTPTVITGSVISEPIYQVKRSNSVNGQVLKAPNLDFVKRTNGVDFEYDNVNDRGTFELQPGDDIDWTDYFEVGDTILVTGSKFDTVSFDYSVDGTYVIYSLSATDLVVADATTVNNNWNLVDGNSTNGDVEVERTQDRTVGPFTLLNYDGVTFFYLNVTASSGLFKDDGTQIAVSVDFEVTVTPTDAAGTPIAAASTYTGTLDGSSQTRESQSVTLKIPAPSSGTAVKWQIEAKRTSDTDNQFEGNVVDEIKWRDLYTVTPVTDQSFGNVTIVRTRTEATEGALALKKRKLNMLVGRKVTTDGSGYSEIEAGMSASARVDDILIFAATDPKIGRRDISEVNVSNIQAVIAEVEAYFGTDLAIGFNATYDDSNVSFEETAQHLARAAFCEAYRRASQVDLTFERADQLPTMLFNHRNKLPGSEKRTVTFGNRNKYDGVEIDYVNPNTDALEKYFIPESQTAQNPEIIQTFGIRSKLQAYFHAYREWNRIRYQNEQTEFTATHEADLLAPRERIIVADNTRSTVIDGEVIDQDGVTLELSQPVDLSTGGPYTIWLQLYDGTTESIAVTQGVDEYHVVLNSAPSLALVTDLDKYARTTFAITADDSKRASSFLVAEKSPADRMQVSVKAISYDDRVYANDVDFINGDVTEDGDLNLTPQPLDKADGYEFYYAKGTSPSTVYKVTTFDDCVTFGTETTVFTAPNSSRIRSMTVSPNQQFLAIALSNAPYVAVYDLETDSMLLPVADIGTSVTRADRIAWNPTSDQIAIGFEGSQPYFARYSVPDMVRMADPIGADQLTGASGAECVYNNLGQLYVYEDNSTATTDVNLYSSDSNGAVSKNTLPGSGYTVDMIYRTGLGDTRLIGGISASPNPRVYDGDIVEQTAPNPQVPYGIGSTTGGHRLAHCRYSDRFFLAGVNSGTASDTIKIYDIDTFDEIVQSGGETSNFVQYVVASQDDFLAAIQYSATRLGAISATDGNVIRSYSTAIATGYLNGVFEVRCIYTP